MFCHKLSFQIYNNGLVMHSNARACDALEDITKKIEDIPRAKTTDLEQDIKAIFESVYCLFDETQL